MRSLTTIVVTLLSAILLLPAAASAQEIIEPRPPLPCGGECWWPVGSVAQLDAIEADIEVTDGKAVARYRFDLSNPSDHGFGGITADRVLQVCREMIAAAPRPHR